MSTPPAHSLSPSTGLPDTLAVVLKTFRVPELLHIIIEELGERNEQDMRYQSSGSLANLILANKSLFGHLQGYLYAQDLDSRFFYGLKFAVLGSRDHLSARIISKYPDALVRPHIDHRFESKGASYTLLHIAAARGHRRTTKKLLGLGASLLNATNLQNVLSRDFRKKLSKEIELGKYLHDITWRPAFAPLIQGDIATFDLLTKNGNDCRVATFNFKRAAVPSERTQCSMTLHHLAAILQNCDESIFWMTEALEKYPWANEFPGGLHKYSVLHFAIKARNTRVVKQLLKSGVGFGAHMVDTEGNSPLHCAIKVAIEANDPSERARSLQIISELKSYNFNSLMVQTRAPYQSPQLLAAKYVPLDWSSKYLNIKPVLLGLLDQGDGPNGRPQHLPPMINEADLEGNTVLGYLAKAIVERRGCKSIETLFKSLVTEYGADINQDVNIQFAPRFYTHSIKFIADTARSCSRFKKMVKDLGGRLHQAEIDGSDSNPAMGPNFGTDQPHAHELPEQHPFALAPEFNKPFLDVKHLNLMFRQSQAQRAVAQHVAARRGGSGAIAGPSVGPRI
ncbi:hypothetical protein F53441_11301 [Fusarium austroafricanum]|uniref:Ankyrin repeat protein n=1 Tax=Fusarium austroafricanum TaxID=2364996 RepID=A0A8H4K361_9HYPO|nr:hypothetical protein F53441_11301 [Fusarium austroafricanum]